MAHRTPRLERWLLAAGVLLLAAVVLRNLGVVTPVLPTVWEEAYNGVELVAIAICVLRALRARGTERIALVVLSVGLAGFAAGDIYYTVALSGLSEPPYPSLADAGYLSAYPAIYVAFVLLLRAAAPRLSPVVWLDGVICALAGAAVGAALVFSVVASTDGPLATVATNLAYPLGDLTTLAFVIAVMAIAGRAAGVRWLLLALAFGTWAIGDGIYLYQAALGTYREYTLLDTCWPAAYLLMAFAVCRPATRLDDRRLRGGMLLLPAAFTLIALGMLALDHYVGLNELALWLATGAVAAAVVRFVLTFRANLRSLDAREIEAATDALTGLGNRRALLGELERLAAEARPDRPVLLALFDLDGFKAYNDTFGHPAGDALLTRLGRNLSAAVGGAGAAYRMGGDEFCLLARGTAGDDFEALLARASAALSESGERFAIRCSYGAVVLCGDGTTPEEALRIADQRMYENKRGGRLTSDETVHQVLLRVAAEHDGDLREHVDDVADLAEAVGRELGLDDDELTELRRAATLHDIGKVAIPDAILHAPRALDDGEWEYMRKHTIIGQRIIGAAPGLAGVARTVRSSHERYDGGGYPDGLAGEQIPLAARIIAVCDAYDAMITTRAYRAARPAAEALAELRRCAGGQFDPAVVAAFTASLEPAAELAAV
ncbi:MAG TPA: HD domain-containing phosphohydrolase [Solirubrobacter sp.]|nr:HD domain-containing phosphohydrolase [Solirubrobacter sp.]